MVTIGRIPGVVNSFFRPQRRFFSQPAWPHFRGLVMAMCTNMARAVENKGWHYIGVAKVSHERIVIRRPEKLLAA